MSNVTTLGYRCEGAQKELERLMADPHAILVDIRFKPYGKPGWNEPELKARWGKRYMRIPELGNELYYMKGHIQIVDLERGITRLRVGLAKGYNIILLCACETYETCHRKVVFDTLLKRLKYSPCEERCGSCSRCHDYYSFLYGDY